MTKEEAIEKAIFTLSYFELHYPMSENDRKQIDEIIETLEAEE